MDGTYLSSHIACDVHMPKYLSDTMSKSKTTGKTTSIREDVRGKVSILLEHEPNLLCVRY
jgi:hypothetical protein